MAVNAKLDEADRDHHAAACRVSGYESRAAGEHQAIRAAGTGAGSSYAQKAGNRPGNRAYAIMSLSS